MEQQEKLVQIKDTPLPSFAGCYLNLSKTQILFVFIAYICIIIFSGVNLINIYLNGQLIEKTI